MLYGVIRTEIEKSENARQKGSIKVFYMLSRLLFNTDEADFICKKMHSVLNGS